MNVAIINGKDILRYLLLVITGIVISFFVLKGMKEKKISIPVPEEKKEKAGILEQFDGKDFIKVSLPMLGMEELEEVTTPKKKLEIPKILFRSELAMLEHVVEKVSKTEPDKKEEVDLATTDKNTSVVEENNIAESFSDEFEGVKVKNQTNFDISEELANPNYQFTNKKEVLIFHTHTCESYTPTENYNYEMTGTYRTTDLNYSVARVGDELDKQLTAYGFEVAHDTTYHDYPAYTGSYGRSLNTVDNLLKNTTSAEMVIDLHRDAVGSNSNYAPTVQIGDEYAAQLMLVMGSDGGGLQHLNWRQNFQMAVKIQRKANELYPGLFRPIILRNSRYNQHLTTGACIIEVGATGNTMEQCLTSMKYLSKVLNDVIKE